MPESLGTRRRRHVRQSNSARPDVPPAPYGSGRARSGGCGLQPAERWIALQPINARRQGVRAANASSPCASPVTTGLVQPLTGSEHGDDTVFVRAAPLPARRADARAMAFAQGVARRARDQTERRVGTAGCALATRHLLRRSRGVRVVTDLSARRNRRQASTAAYVSCSMTRPPITLRRSRRVRPPRGARRCARRIARFDDRGG